MHCSQRKAVHSNEDPAQQKKNFLIPCVAYVKFLLDSIDLEHGIMPDPK